MVERIEKVARVKGIEYDVNRPYDQEENERNGAKQKFAKVLRSVMKRSAPQESTVPDAYRLEITNRATQSLFYQNGLDLRQIGVHLDGKG